MKLFQALVSGAVVFFSCTSTAAQPKEPKPSDPKPAGDVAPNDEACSPPIDELTLHDPEDGRPLTGYLLQCGTDEGNICCAYAYLDGPRKDRLCAHVLCTKTDICDWNYVGTGCAPEELDAQKAPAQDSSYEEEERYNDWRKRRT